jgi:hypothetical protein
MSTRVAATTVSMGLTFLGLKEESWVAVACGLMAAFALLGAALVSAHQRRVSRRVHRCTQLDEISDQVRTTNGTKLAPQVEAQGQLLEVVAGQVHDISKRVDGQGRELGAIHTQVGKIAGVGAVMASYLERSKGCPYLAAQEGDDD